MLVLYLYDGEETKEEPDPCLLSVYRPISKLSFRISLYGSTGIFWASGRSG